MGIAMPDLKKPLPILLQVVICLSLATTALGQAAPPKPMSEEQFVELLQSRLKQVDEVTELDDAAKTKIKDLYKQALEEMTSAKRWTATTARNEELAVSAPKELEQTKAALALPVQPTAAFRPDATLPQIEQAISLREAELEKMRKALDDDEKALKGGADRRAKATKEVNDAKDRLTNVNEQIQLLAAGDDRVTTNAMNSALRLSLVARRRTEEQRIRCYETELMAYEAQTELLPLRRDLEARKVALAAQEIKQWQGLVNQRRQQEAEQQVQRASWEAGQAHPAVLGLVKENAALAAMRKDLAERIVDTTRQREQVNLQLSALKEQFTRVQDKVKAAEKANATNAIGLVLRKKRDSLPNLRTYRQSITDLQQTYGKGQVTLQELQEKRYALPVDLETQTQAVLASLNVAQYSGDPVELETAVREAVKTERDYLDVLISDHNAYFDKLLDLVAVEQQLIDETEKCALFIDERVLWIASAGPLSAADVRNASAALWWLARPDAGLDIGRTLVADVVGNPAISAFALLVFVVLIYWRMRMSARLQEIGEITARGSCYRFLPTLESTLLTALISAGWPGLMWYFGWRLTGAANASELCKAVGCGLSETSRVYLALELLRHTCCYRGLGESHFGWSASALKLLRHNIRWFSLPLLLLMCVTVAMAWQENDRWDSSLGRMCFVSALLCFAFVLHRILRPTSSVFQAMIASRSDGWLDRFRYVWYPLIVLTPASLAILAAVGYHYTARQLIIRLILTMYVLVGGIVCRALLLRWTLVNQRKLAIEQARQRRAAAQSENNSGDEATGATDLPASTTPERDLATINTQTRRLIEYSLAVASALAIWCAWIDVLPALGSINWSVGTTEVAVAVKLPLPNGGTKVDFQKEYRDVKLSDLLLAAIILATTVIAAKNIPGLLEMAVLQHLPFDAGARYAVATVCRYVIIIVGVLLCCAILGVGWSKVQWLVAAITLGLGFGLQEIFANFVSGLIILFERPVRVGDVVTIDATTGVVSRIRMRATTIIDGDRKELIIPNKEFITGRVLNWTLTDPVNRAVVNVGIAYGSDTERVSEILLRIAEEHPQVLDDPPPGVVFESFGDSTLNFVLRCFLPNVECRGPVLHELHMAVDREFRAAGIEIAFPQQDVHVRSIDLQLPGLQPALGGGAAWPPVQKVA